MNCQQIFFDSVKLASHIEEREFFINKMAEIEKEYQEMGLSKDQTWYVYHFLLHWITIHTMSLDQTLKDLFEQVWRWKLSNCSILSFERHNKPL